MWRIKLLATGASVAYTGRKGSLTKETAFQLNTAYLNPRVREGQRQVHRLPHNGVDTLTSYFRKELSLLIKILMLSFFRR